VHYWADLQSVHGFRCYERENQRALVLAICLVKHVSNFLAVVHEYKIGYSLFIARKHKTVFFNKNMFSPIVTKAQQFLRWATSAKEWGLLCPFPLGELGAHLTQCRLSLGLPPYQVSS